MANLFSRSAADNTWQENPDDVVLISNRSRHNFILELPTGRYRLDAGRRMRTLRSVLKIDQVRTLVEQGELVVE